MNKMSKTAMKVDSEWDEDKGQSQGNHARLNRIMHYALL